MDVCCKMYFHFREARAGLLSILTDILSQLKETRLAERDASQFPLTTIVLVTHWEPIESLT